MKAFNHKVLGVSLLMLLSVSLMQAQTSRTGYFMENYSYRYMANPAFAPTHGFISVPLLGNLETSFNTNSGASDFFFPLSDGSLGTFLHPEISSDLFLNGLQDFTSLGLDLDMGILNAGFYVGRNFFTVGINLHEDFSADVPKDAFALLKQRMDNGTKTYHIQGLNAVANAYADISLGMSTDIFDNLRVGGRLKLLLGIAAADLNVSKLDASMSDELWQTDAVIDANVYGRGIEFELEDESPHYVSGVRETGDYGIAGTGFAGDLGVTYEPI